MDYKRLWEVLKVDYQKRYDSFCEVLSQLKQDDPAYHAKKVFYEAIADEAKRVLRQMYILEKVEEQNEVND